MKKTTWETVYYKDLFKHFDDLTDEDIKSYAAEIRKYFRKTLKRSKETTDGKYTDTRSD